MQRHVDAMVRDATLREIVGADLGAAIAGRDLRAPLRRVLGLRLGELRVVEPRAQHLHGARPVLDLRPLVLTGDHEPARQVGDAHGRIGRVDALPTATAGAVDVHAQVLLAHLDVHVLDLGQHRDRGGRRVDATRRLGRRHALHAMDAGLELHLAVHALALEREDDLLEPAGIGLGQGEHLLLPAARLREPAVHAIEIGREQRRLLAADTTADLDDDVLVVVRVARQEQLAQLAGEHRGARLELGQLGLRQLGQFGVARGDRLAIVGDGLRQPAMLTRDLDRAHDTGALARQVAQLRRIARHLGLGEQPIDLGEARLDADERLLQMRVEHQRASVGIGRGLTGRRPRRSCRPGRGRPAAPGRRAPSRARRSRPRTSRGRARAS